MHFNKKKQPIKFINPSPNSTDDYLYNVRFTARKRVKAVTPFQNTHTHATPARASARNNGAADKLTLTRDVYRPEALIPSRSRFAIFRARSRSSPAVADIN